MGDLNIGAEEEEMWSRQTTGWHRMPQCERCEVLKAVQCRQGS